MRTVLVLGLATTGACHEAARPVVNNAARIADRDPCEMIQAMLSIDSDGYRRTYARSEDDASATLIVDVQGPASLVPPHTTCPGRSFSIFHGERDVDWMIVRLIVFASTGRSWNFMATRYQPNPKVLADGSFESGQYYGAAIGGFVEWTGTSWRTFTDVDRVLEESARAHKVPP